MSAALRIELAWPAKQLSPNSRAHHMEKWRYQKAAKDTAYWLTRGALKSLPFEHDGAIQIHIVAHPKTHGPLPDADNLIASCKGLLDGIAMGLGVNDRLFKAPTVEWAARCEHGKLIVEVGA